jgi:hypothetical protein
MKSLAPYRLPLAAFAIATAIAIGAHFGCKGADPNMTNAQPADSSGAQPIDTDVMAFLSAARALHHEADIKEDAHDLPGAIAAMDRLTRLPRPHPNAIVVEVEEVLADSFARRAELLLRMNDIDGALGDIDKGLEHATDPTYFRGHLLEVEGIVEKTRAESLADAGHAAEAARAKERAISLLEEAVRVQEQVIVRSLVDAGSIDRDAANDAGAVMAPPSEAGK